MSTHRPNSAGAGPHAANEPQEIVREALRLVQLHIPAAQAAQLQAIEAALRKQYGGENWYVSKTGRPKAYTPEQAQRVYQSGLGTGENAEIMAKHGISRATLYRMMKRRAAND